MSRLNSKHLGVALVVLVASLGMFVALSNEAFAGKLKETKDFEAIALKFVSERNNLLNTNLEIVNSAKAEFPLKGKTAFQYKVADKSSGAIYGITLDDNGKEIDIEKLATDEQNAKAAKHGKLERALEDKLAGAPKNEDISVVIWLKEPPYTPPVRPAVDSDIPVADRQSDDNLGNSPAAKEKLKEVEDYLTKADAQRADAVEKVVAPVVEKLKKQGHEVSTDKSAPIVFASMKPDKIEEVAQWNEVDTVYLSPLNEPHLNIARPTIAANTVYNRGIAGFGVRVGEIEVGGRAQTANPYLGPPTLLNDLAGSCLTGHSTYVAGILRSWNPTYFGIAPGMDLRVGGNCTGVFGTTLGLGAAETRAADWGARVLTNSWGSTSGGRALTVMDRFMDEMVRNRFRTVVFAAGNRGGFDDDVTSPGLAYNIITVGAFDDQNTLTKTDDRMASYSSWDDPISTFGDREKPEVVAPGSRIISTLTASPWVGTLGSGNGTSYSAPMVAAEAALLLQRDVLSGFLAVWPEAVKAIIMTTAYNNIEGAARLSEKDGAGGIAADKADELVRRVNGNWGTLDYNCGAASPLTLTTMSLTAGQRVRATFVYDTNPAYGFYSTRPSADLDLGVVNATGATVASSSSFDNTYEIVDFNVPSTGNYRMNVTNFSCSLSPGYAGWAWKR